MDYAGHTVPVTDRHRGEVMEAQIFVAVLGASNYTYAEATWDQSLSSWIGSQRTKKNTLSRDRRDRLDALVGWNWDAHAALWEEGFFYLQEFVDKSGHSRVAAGYVLEDGFQLGGWVNSQRKNKGKISQDRRVRLEAIPGWSWGPNDEQWEESFAHLQEFVSQHGHCRVAQSYKTADGFRLGVWVSVQRTNKDKTPLERIERLTALPGWCWDSLIAKWEQAFGYLQEFVQQEGHSKVSTHFKTANGYKLGSWVSIQRKNRDGMLPERKIRLEALPGWRWNAIEESWEAGFAHLQKFVHKEGHCKVPNSFRTPDGFRLGVWVTVQRMKKNRMSQERRERLAALSGWIWDALEEQWGKMFGCLREFAHKEGHCRVPTSFKTPDGKLLGVWVGRQRLQREALSDDRKNLLEQLPGWSWDNLESQWEEAFEHLQKFAKGNGHYNVPKRFKTESGYQLGFWVARQKKNADAMSQNRKNRLEALPGWTWSNRI